MDFSNTLKRLRQASSTTQEQLANHLSLSAQAISRWENGTAMPDISYLPKIALYFGVSVDYLLGVDCFSYDEKVKKICQEAFMQKADTKKGYYERLKIYREGIKMYPSNWKLKMDLARALFASYEDDFYSFSKEEISENLSQMNELCEDIVLHCESSHYKYDALRYMAFVAEQTHNVNKTRQFVSDLPETFKSFEPLMIKISTGEHKEFLIDNYIREMDIEICDMLLEKSKNQDRDTIINNYLKANAVHEALADIYVYDLIRDGQITDWWELFISVDEWDTLLASLQKSIEKATKIADTVLSDDKKYIYSLLLTQMSIFMEWSKDKLADSKYYDLIINMIKEGENLIKSKVADYISDCE